MQFEKQREEQKLKGIREEKKAFEDKDEAMTVIKDHHKINILPVSEAQRYEVLKARGKLPPPP